MKINLILKKKSTEHLKVKEQKMNMEMNLIRKKRVKRVWMKKKGGMMRIKNTNGEEEGVIILKESNVYVEEI